jgi:uncharacterized protein YggE
MKMHARFVAIVSLAVFAMCGAVEAQTIQVDKNNRTIAITATDKAIADADLAVVHIGFQNFGADEQSTYAEGSKTSNAIMDALKKAGVPDKSIESEQQSLNRNQEFRNDIPPAERAARQFVIIQSWNVKVKPAEAANVLHTAVLAGANQSGQINWQYQDMKGLQATAAANALVKAKAIADQMASGLNVKLSGLIYASNQAPESPVRPIVVRSAMMRMTKADTVAPLAIRQQQVEESATVYAVFAIE